MKTIKRELIIEIIVFLFVLLFLYAAGSKLTDYNAFIGQMGKSPLLTDFAPVLAWMVPVTEIVISVLLIVLKWRLIGLYASFGLIYVFTVYIVFILFFSAETPCACGGILSMLGWREHLVFNVFFVTLASIGIILESKRSVKVQSTLQPNAI